MGGRITIKGRSRFPNVPVTVPRVCLQITVLHPTKKLGLCLGWYDHLMAFYKATFNWVTWSPPKFDTLLASWYPKESFMISHSSCAEQYGDMSSDRHTHSHTIKPPTAGVRQVGHTSIMFLINISMCVE